MIRTNWQDSVDEVERGLSACLTALDRYERSFHDALNAEPPSVSEMPTMVEGKITGWSERLATAGERAAAVERLLAEQEVVWERWRDAVGRWKETLQQLPAGISAGG